MAYDVQPLPEAERQLVRQFDSREHALDDVVVRIQVVISRGHFDRGRRRPNLQLHVQLCRAVAFYPYAVLHHRPETLFENSTSYIAAGSPVIAYLPSMSLVPFHV